MDRTWHEEGNLGARDDGEMERRKLERDVKKD